MASGRGLVVLLGAAASGRSTLARSIASREGDGPSPDRAWQWRIDNKYYSADVELQTHDLGSQLPAADAVLLVVDATDQQSFNVARLAWEAAMGGEEDNPDGPEVQLLVAAKLDLLMPAGQPEPRLESVSRPPWLQDAAEW